MKTVYTLLFLSILFLACDKKDDDDSIRVSAEFSNALKTLYPDATRIEWEKKGQYTVADFRLSNTAYSVWFSANAEWLLAESDINYASLPVPVQTAFRNGEYATWKIDDTDLVERPQREKIYRIEAEKGEQEVDLFYLADGTLVKKLTGSGDHNEDLLPAQLPAKIRDYIQNHYPQAKIIDAEVSNGITEVEILDNNRIKEVLFDYSDEWVSTTWEVALAEVPQIVKNAAMTAYPGYVVDDAKFIENKQGTCYLLELESVEKEVKVRIDENGTIL